MNRPVHILHLEDEETDAELMRSALHSAGIDCDVFRVASQRDFVAALSDGGFDLILADYNLPSFDGLTALELAHRKCPDVPFIFLSGLIGEEVALESLKSGATDYVFKHNLQRLGPAVRRALQEAAGRRERLQAEAALHESEATLRSFFNTAPFMMGVVELLPDDILHLSDNAASAHFFGTTPESMRGRRTSQLGVPARTIAVWLRLYHEARKLERPVRFDYVHQRSDREHRLSVTISPLRVAPGQAPRFCYVAEDTTDKKLLEQQFFRAQRLESIGALAGGIAHDLNNVLAPMLVSLRVFRAKLTTPEEQELLDNLEASARRGATIVRQVLTFARGAEGARNPVQLKQVIADLELMIRETFPRSIQVMTEVPDEPWRILGDTTQVYQVLMNLCLNARDAMLHGGRLVIRAENRALDEAHAGFHPDARPGNYVTLTVADTGTGIPPGLQSKIFDPFFTTKDIGKGTGLGLSTALTIIKGHGGFVSVFSESGRGSDFTVYLPAQREPVAPVAGESTPAPSPRGCGELILIVDDEMPVRQAMKVALSGQGYEVLTASGGAEALALFSRRSREIRLVVTDLMMPGMDGSTLIQALREISPDLRIIAMSGLLEFQLTPETARWDKVAFLHKPFTPEDLFLKVHELATMAGTPALL